MRTDEPGLRSLLADNPGAFTLDGTRTFLVGRTRAAVIDPGPDLDPHVEALADALADAASVAILLTHGHDDHAAAAPRLARLTGAAVVGAGPVERRLAHGDGVETDAGRLVAVATPGHSPEHLCFHWPERDALFAGDLMLGAGDTTWVAGYPRCIADYLGSLDRLLALGLRRIYPTHGPPIDDVETRIGRFRAHREARIGAVRSFLEERPGAGRLEVLSHVYGEVPPALRGAALESVDALMEHLRARGGG